MTAMKKLVNKAKANYYDYFNAFRRNVVPKGTKLGFKKYNKYTWNQRHNVQILAQAIECPIELREQLQNGFIHVHTKNNDWIEGFLFEKYESNKFEY